MCNNLLSAVFADSPFKLCASTHQAPVRLTSQGCLSWPKGNCHPSSGLLHAGYASCTHHDSSKALTAAQQAQQYLYAPSDQPTLSRGCLMCTEVVSQLICPCAFAGSPEAPLPQKESDVYPASLEAPQLALAFTGSTAPPSPALPTVFADNGDASEVMAEGLMPASSLGSLAAGLAVPELTPPQLAGEQCMNRKPAMLCTNAPNCSKAAYGLWLFVIFHICITSTPSSLLWKRNLLHHHLSVVVLLFQGVCVISSVAASYCASATALLGWSRPSPRCQQPPS